MTLTADQERYWRAFLAASPDALVGASQHVIADHPGSPEIADHLIDLYLQGTKTAGSGIVEDYVSAGDPLPQVGDHWIALDSHGEPRCILRTVSVETHPFEEVPARIAIAEGEGDLSLDHWRAVHAAHYAPHLQGWGLTRIEDATVVTEHFQLVYAKAPAPSH